MKIRIFKKFLLLVAGVLFFFSCEIGNNPNKDIPDPDSNFNVYVYGNYNDGTNWFAYYWGDGYRYLLPVRMASGSSVHRVASADGNRYAAGEFWTKDADDEACYWINEKDPFVIGPGCALDISVTDDAVYVLGHDYDYSGHSEEGIRLNYNYWYWTSGMTKLYLKKPNNNPVFFIYPQSIEVNNGDVYIAGYYYDSTDPAKVTTACYWNTNGQCTDLGGPACAYDLVFQNGDMYVAGGYVEGINYYLGNDTAWMSCLWEKPNADKR